MEKFLVKQANTIGFIVTDHENRSTYYVDVDNLFLQSDILIFQNNFILKDYLCTEAGSYQYKYFFYGVFFNKTKLLKIHDCDVEEISNKIDWTLKNKTDAENEIIEYDRIRSKQKITYKIMNKIKNLFYTKGEA